MYVCPVFSLLIDVKRGPLTDTAEEGGGLVGAKDPLRDPHGVLGGAARDVVELVVLLQLVVEVLLLVQDGVVGLRDTSKKPFKSQFCSKTFTSSAYKIHHEKSVHAEKGGYKCKSCDKVFSANFRKLEHWRQVHATDKIACPQCPKTFVSRSFYEWHKKKYHYSLVTAIGPGRL